MKTMKFEPNRSDADPSLGRLTGFAASHPSNRSDRGQSTAEYALLILGVASIALLVLAWAGSTGAIGDLFDKVINWVSSQVA